MSALLCAFYGIMPWDQGRLTRAQMDNLMQELGYVRYLQDEAALLYYFGKATAVADEKELPAVLRKMADPAEKDDPLSRLRQRAFEMFAYRRYGMPLSHPEADVNARTAPALDLSAAAARGILSDVEDGNLSDNAWVNLYRGGVFRAVCAAAGEPLTWGV